MDRRGEQIGDATLYLGDCLEVMAELGPVDAVVTDPPYGIGEAAGKNHSRGKLAKVTKFEFMKWDNQPASAEQVEAMRRAGGDQIIFGGNFFNLPPASCWLVWDKENGANDFADCELAWTNLSMSVRRLKFKWAGMLQEDMKSKERREHPTQKPIPVMEWCLGFIPDAQIILDPFMGSGTTGVACANLGRKFIGIEIEPKYFDIACRRIELAASQVRMEFDKPKPEQLEIGNG